MRLKEKVQLSVPTTSDGCSKKLDYGLKQKKPLNEMLIITKIKSRKRSDYCEIRSRGN